MTQNMAGTQTVLSSAIVMLFGVMAFTQAFASTLKHSTPNQFIPAFTAQFTCLFLPGGSDGKRLPIMREAQVRSLRREDPQEKEMAIRSSTLVWKIPWTEETGEL